MEDEPPMLHRLKSILRPSRPNAAKQWPHSTDLIPWFDHADAMEQLQQRHAQGRYNDEEAALLQQWITEGYVILPNQVTGKEIDAMNDEVTAVWEKETPLEGLQIEGVRRNESDPFGMSHEALLQIPLQQRLAMREEQRWRIHGFHLHSDNARAVFQNKGIQDLCSMIFDCEALPHYSINFMYGSLQELHQDTCVFHVHPRNYLIGAWLACEDVNPDSGPLVYYPGSHRTELFEAFDNYPQTNLRTCSTEDITNYYAHVEQQAARFERKQFLAKKGDVLLWHGMLIHGGSPIKQPELTRKSHVTHYIPQNMDKSTRVVGPFNWG